MILNSTNVQSDTSDTHLGMTLDSILNRVDDNNNKCNQRLKKYPKLYLERAC